MNFDVSPKLLLMTIFSLDKLIDIFIIHHHLGTVNEAIKQ